MTRLERFTLGLSVCLFIAGILTLDILFWPEFESLGLAAMIALYLRWPAGLVTILWLYILIPKGYCWLDEILSAPRRYPRAH